MKVRAATAADHATLVRFNAALASESEGLVLNPATLAQGVAQVLADPARGHYFLAMGDLGDAPLGALLVTQEWSDWRNAYWLWIQSVYVEPTARRRGVYRALHAHVVEQAAQLGAAGVRLYVEPNNSSAQATYRALGMSKTYDVMEQARHMP